MVRTLHNTLHIFHHILLQKTKVIGLIHPLSFPRNTILTMTCPTMREYHRIATHHLKGIAREKVTWKRNSRRLLSQVFHHTRTLMAVPSLVVPMVSHQTTNKPWWPRWYELQAVAVHLLSDTNLMVHGREKPVFFISFCP
jgi:hypothetical protein